MKILVIDTEYNELNVHEADRVSLQDYYKLLHCDLIDAATRVIGDDKRKYTIICDDEGMLKDKRIVSATDSDYHPQFVNSIAITRCDEEGDDIGLTDEDLAYLKQYIKKISVYDRQHFEYIPGRFALAKCDFVM